MSRNEDDDNCNTGHCRADDTLIYVGSYFRMTRAKLLRIALAHALGIAKCAVMRHKVHINFATCRQ